MLDLHCHILPGLDDGAAELGVSLEMAALAADSGVTHVFATPHCNTRNPQKNFRSRELIEAYTALQRELDRAGIPIRILSGAEVLGALRPAPGRRGFHDPQRLPLSAGGILL